jgi:hypothetical protein
MTETKYGPNPEVSFNMTPAFEGLLESATRKFTRDGESSLLVEDNIRINQNTKTVSWQLMTIADVEITDSGATLKQNGKELFVRNLSHPGKNFSVVYLDPPPLELDKRIDGLKRIELRINVDENISNDPVLDIKVSLSDDKNFKIN